MATDRVQIVLTEDDDDIRVFVSIILRRAGFDVESFATVEAALDARNRCHADLYILDVRMPGLSGLDMCRELRASSQDDRILMMSAETSDANVAAALAAGANDYLPKPFSRRELLRRVNLLLDTDEGEGPQ